MVGADFLGWAEEATEAMRRAWAWWFGELASLLPEKLRAKLAKDEVRIVVDFSGEEVRIGRYSANAYEEIAQLLHDVKDRPDEIEVAGEIIRQSLMPDTKLVIRLPANVMLKRSLRYPLAARRNLRAILQHELERQSPVDPGEVYFDYRILGRNADLDRLDVELRLVKRTELDGAIALCKALGCEPVEAEFASERGIEEGAFLIATGAMWGRRLQRLTTAGLVLVLVLLTIGLSFAALGRQGEEVDALAGEVAKARREAAVVMHLEEEVKKARERIDFLGNYKKAPLFTQMLTDVTKTLPDDSWIFEFEFGGKGIRIHGLSNSASNLIALFDNSPAFTNAEFRSPVMQGPAKELERFDMSFDLKGGRR